MTVIEIRPHRWGWKAFESPGVEPVFSNKEASGQLFDDKAGISGLIPDCDYRGPLAPPAWFRQTWFGARTGMSCICVSRTSSV